LRHGIYHDYLQVLDKDRITLKGKHATLRSAATPAPTLGNSVAI
jgi:hypothetical protein